MFRTTLYIIIATVSFVLTSDVLKFATVDHIDCKANKMLCPHYKCELSFITREVKALTWFCDLTEQIDVVNIQVTLYYRYRAGYKKFLIDLNIDVCSYYSKQLDSAVMNLVRAEVTKYSTNLIHPCPFKGNLSLVGLPLTSSLVNNMFVPAGEYKLVMNTKIKEEKLFGVITAIYFKVPAGRTLEDDRMG